MKRIISVFLLAMFIFTMNVSADEYDLITSSYDNYSANISVTLSVSKPTEVLKLLGKYWVHSGGVDLQKLAEGLCDSDISGVVKCSINSDYTKLKASYEIYSVIPLTVNDNFKSTNELKFGMWIDWDISDENNPKMTYIYSTPMSDKYAVMNMEDMIDGSGMNFSEFASLMKNYLDKEHVGKINSEFAEILRKNSTISSKGTKAVITITDKQLADIICDTIDLVLKDMDDYKQIDELVSDENNAAALPDSAEIKKFFENVKIFDSNALVIEIGKTKGGALSSVLCRANMCIGSELLKNAVYEEDADKVTDLKFSIDINTVYTAINNGVKVTFPELNSDNSISFAELFGYDYDYDYDWDGDECIHNEHVYIENEYIEAVPDTFYVNLNSYINTAERYGYDYELTNNNGVVTLKDNNKKEVFGQVSMTVGSKVITVDSAEYTALNPVIVKGGDVYIDTEAVKSIFNADMLHFDAEIFENISYMSFERQSPQCHHTKEDIDAWYDDYDDYDEDYCNHYQHLGSYDAIGRDYGVLRDVCYAFFFYEADRYSLIYDNGVITLTDLSGKEKFNTVIFTVGSDEYTVDGTVLKSNQPAVEKDDTVYVDIHTLAELFGAEITDGYMAYNRGYVDENGNYVKGFMTYSYNIQRKSPYCPHTFEEIKKDN